MANRRLPPLRPAERKQDVPKGSSDARQSSSSELKLSLEPANADSVNSCRALHAFWNQDVKEVTLRLYRVESNLRSSQEEARRNVQRDEDMHKLRAEVYVLGEKVHMLQGEVQNQLLEHQVLSQDLRAQLHRARELMHQITGDIQGLKEEQNPGLSEATNASDESDAASGPATPEAMTGWDSMKPDGSSGQ